MHRSESEVLRGEGAIAIVRPGLGCNLSFPPFVVPMVKGVVCVCGGGVPAILSLYPQSHEEQVRHTFHSTHFGRV